MNSYTVEYENVEFRWWNPYTWYANISYDHNNLSSITITVRARKMFVHADASGHKMIENSNEEQN